MVLNNLFPVFALILFGSLLKRFRLTNDTFLKTSDKLIYYIFFPALLFWKIGGTSTVLFSSSGLYKAVICSVLTVFVLSSLFIKLHKVPAYKAGTFSQSCYRFNTYIGVAIVLNALGEEGIQQFGILIGIIIPIINVLAVSILIWFSDQQIPAGNRMRQTAKALISNPLIIACICGILYAYLQIGFPRFINNTLQLASFVTLPLALLSIGGGLTLSGMKDHLNLSLIASFFKLLVLPLTGFLFFKLFSVTGLSFQVGMVFFALPTSAALYVLSSQLNSDTNLASASIALSTILSFFSLSIALFI
jgi:predicted permease